MKTQAASPQLLGPAGPGSRCSVQTRCASSVGVRAQKVFRVADVPRVTACAVHAPCGTFTAGLPAKPITSRWRIQSTAVVLLPTVVALGVVNRVLNKMVLVPMGGHAVFLAQFQTMCYMLVYSAILVARMRAGLVPQEVFKCAVSCWPAFLLIGSLEALGTLLLFTATASLPGAAVPLLQQSLLLWNFLLSMVFLGRRFARSEILGAVGVMTGVILASTSSSSAAGGGGAIAAGPVAMFLVAMLAIAVDSIAKERLFSYVRDKTGQQMDLFIVNTFCTVAQALVTLLLVPVVLYQQGHDLASLPVYLAQGAALMLGTTDAGRLAGGSAWVTARYIICNLFFNVAALAALRKCGAATVAVTMTAVVPLTIWAFTFDLPLIGVAPPLATNFWLGAMLVLSGLVSYYSKTIRKSARDAPPAAA